LVGPPVRAYYRERAMRLAQTVAAAADGLYVLIPKRGVEM
jgi:hypothetical protein